MTTVNFKGGKATFGAALGKLAKSIDKGGKVKVGFLEGATYPDGTSVPMVAAINEFGAPSRGQPPRPFFRRMIAAESCHWSADMAKLLKANDYDVVKTLKLTGEEIAGELRQSITDLVSPPLKQSTIDRKGFDKPLIEHGIMLNAVDYEVETK